MLIVALPLSAERRIREILQQVRVLPVDVRLSAYSLDFSFPRRGGASGLIEVMRRPLDGWAWLVKRALDVLGASVALLILSPVMIATAIAIKLDSPGPVFFRQMRHGYNNRPVPVLKFRSMYVDQNDPTARKVVSRGDPRVTRVGRFIRRWSIDELPQLLNVLKGDLSLVGPRPHVLDAVSSHQRAFEEIVEGYAARHRVPPGLTGWAQIQGWRGEIDAPEKLEARVAHDLHYIENWSIWLDLYILFVTPFRLLDGRNAY
jgi:exopolysaccharide biosynthesis polyprenyl glycosylphosphotransferase